MFYWQLCGKMSEIAYEVEGKKLKVPMEVSYSTLLGLDILAK